MPTRQTAHLPNFSTFELHVWLTDGKWIHILGLIEIGKGVVDKAMSGFIGTDRANDIHQLAVFGQSPVVDGDVGRGRIFPFGKVTLFEIIDKMGTERWLRESVSGEIMFHEGEQRTMCRRPPLPTFQRSGERFSG